MLKKSTVVVEGKEQNLKASKKAQGGSSFCENAKNLRYRTRAGIQLHVFQYRFPTWVSGSSMQYMRALTMGPRPVTLPLTKVGLKQFYLGPTSERFPLRPAVISKERLIFYITFPTVEHRCRALHGVLLNSFL